MQIDIISKAKAIFKWIKGHKYIFVTLVFLAIIVVVDDNNMLSHIKNQSTISRLEAEIEAMEVDSAEIQAKLKLYTDGDPSVIEDIAREQGLQKKNEDIYIIEK